MENYVILKFNNDKAIPVKSDKTISTEYKEESRNQYSRPEFDYIDFQPAEKQAIASLSLEDYENRKIDTKSSGIKTFERFNNLIDHLNKYNHFVIKNAWYKGYTDLLNKLLEPSILCADKNDSEVTCNSFSCWARRW